MPVPENYTMVSVFKQTRKAIKRLALEEGIPMIRLMHKLVSEYVLDQHGEDIDSFTSSDDLGLDE